jgi:hypothetical protein
MQAEGHPASLPTRVAVGVGMEMGKLERWVRIKNYRHVGPSLECCSKFIEWVIYKGAYHVETRPLMQTMKLQHGPPDLHLMAAERGGADLQLHARPPPHPPMLFCTYPLPLTAPRRPRVKRRTPQPENRPSSATTQQFRPPRLASTSPALESCRCPRSVRSPP